MDTADSHQLDLLKRVEQAVDDVAAGMKKRRDLILDLQGPFVKFNPEDDFWIVCELEIIGWGSNARAILACYHAEFTIPEGAPSGFPACFYTGDIDGRDQKPVLVDVAKLIDGPKAVSGPTFICLQFIEDSDDFRSEVLPLGPNLSSEPTEAVREGKGGFGRVSAEWLNNSAHDVIKRATQIPHGVTDHGVQALVDLVTRLKNNFNLSFPLVVYEGEVIRVRRCKAADDSLYVRDVCLCPLDFGARIRKVETAHV